MRRSEVDKINKRRDKIKIWEWHGEHYTDKDIPDWVKEKIPLYLVKNWDGDIGEAFRFIMKFERHGGTIFMMDEEIHFNRKGYERIIAFVERRELMLPEDIEKWREEVLEIA